MPLFRALLATALVTLAACGGGDEPTSVTPPPQGTNSAIVSMPGNSFSPFSVTITVGGSVRYDFPAVAHNVIFDRRTGAPTDIQITSNRSVTRTFPTAGTFPYDCTLHPGMSGEVIVR